MTDMPSPTEMQTKPLGTKSEAKLSILHVIPHLRWEREWYESFEIRRAKLLNTLSRLHEQMGGVAGARQQFMKSFLLSGQTVILEDIAAVRPDLVAMLVIYNAGGRLGIGPWYVNVDEALVSGESLIRNLLAGRADAVRYGLKLMPVAYTPDLSGHIAQLPQILLNFGIDAGFLRHGAPVVHLPFRWEAPDGSSILVINHESRTIWPHTVESAEDVAGSVRAQHIVRPDGPFLWLFDSGESLRSLVDAAAEVEQQTGLTAKQSDLTTFVRALRRELPDNMRPSLRGELRLQALRENTYLLPGTLSARIHLKQANARLQSFLSYAVEPWLAVALTHGKPNHPDNLRAMLNYSWRLLLKNQSRNALGGTSSDVVHEENELRSRQIEDSSQQVLTGVLDALSGTVHHPGSVVEADQTHVLVWNPHNWSVRQVVEVPIDLPEGKYPARLLSPERDEQLFGWTPSAEGGTLIFLADTPAVGYAAYTLELSDTSPSERYLTRTIPGSVIGTANGDAVFIEGDVLIWRSGETFLPDVLRFFDGGDAGDIYNYSPPDPDVEVQADLINDVQIESCPVYERLVIHHRMRIAPGLRPDRSRDRGVKLIELTTTATLYENIPGVHFRTTFTNTANDHRLRAHLRTHLRGDRVLVGSPFALIERKALLEGLALPPDEMPNIEGVANTQPLQGVVAVTGEESTLALLARGLPEYEAIEEDDQLTLAVTLLRAVGWLSRDDLRTRTAAVAPMMPVPGAQCQRDFTAEYALMMLPENDRAALLRANAEFDAPVQAYQYRERPQRGRRSFLSTVSNMAIGGDSDGSGAILTAFKPPEKGQGWVVRLFNPHDHPVEVYVTPHEHPEKVALMTLAEEIRGYLDADVNGRTLVNIQPHEIITLLITFRDNAIV